MCDKFILENGEMLMFIPDCYKNQKIVNKIVDYYSYALEFLADCYKTQKCVIKTVDTYLSAIQFVPEWSKTQKIPDKAIGTCSFVFACVTN